MGDEGQASEVSGQIAPTSQFSPRLGLEVGVARASAINKGTSDRRHFEFLLTTDDCHTTSARCRCVINDIQGRGKQTIYNTLICIEFVQIST